MKPNLTILIVFINILLIGNVSAEIYRTTLSKNPFIKPGHVNVKEKSRRNIENIESTISDDSLRATLVSGGDSIANISGQMVFVGEKIHGYELISVGIGSAKLIKNGNEVVLHVNEIHKKMK